MSFLRRQADPLDVTPYEGRAEAYSTPTEIYNSAAKFMQYNQQSYSERNQYRDVFKPILEEIAEKTGERFHNPAGYLGVTDQPGVGVSNYEGYANKIFAHIQENQELFPDLEGISLETIREQGAELARQAQEEYQAVKRRSRDYGFLSAEGRAELGAGFMNFIADPGGQATLLIPGAQLPKLGVNFTQSLTKFVAAEFALGAGSELVIQAGVKDWYDKQGMEYTYEDFWKNVLLGGAFNVGGSAVLQGTLRGAGRGVSMTSDQAKEIINILKRAGTRPTKDADVGLRVLDDMEETLNANPLGDDAAGNVSDIGPATNEHIQRVEAAQTALELDEPVVTPDTPNSPPRPPETIYEVEEKSGIPELDIDNIQVDAETFQFKSGGDKFGVTEKLQGVTEWNPYYAGTVTVWERADGVQFIADGHQRLGLAKRIKAMDPDQDVKLYGHVFREVDGETASKVRVRAAMNNVANNTADALDIAKILKEAPEMANQLPKYSAAGRQGKDLVNLAIENWGYVYNKIIPANYAAIVARLIPEADKELQEAALKILAKSDPANEVQAEAIVRQVRDIEADTVVQESLFGEEMFKESLIVERAEVLDRALKQLRLDKRSFKNLVDQQNRLEAEGNKLVEAANKKRVDTDGKAIEYINILANRKGEVSDALSDAARVAKDTGRTVEAARGFADYVRGRIENGDFRSLEDGGVGRYADDPPKEQRVQNKPEQELADFSDVANGKGFQEQLDAIEAEELPMSEKAEREMIENGEIAPNYTYYLELTDDAIEIPTQNIIPIRARKDGIARGRELMADAAKGGMSKRGPLSVRDNGDGTYTLLDGNSTYAIASEAGMPKLPARVLTMEEFAREEALKAASKIQKSDGKPKRRRVNANDMGKDEFVEFFTTLRMNQGYDDLDTMLKDGAVVNELLNDRMEAIASDMGLTYYRGPVKGADRAAQKIRDKYMGNVSMLADVARTGVTVNDPKEIDEILKRFAQPGGYHVVYEDFGMTDLGYFDAKASLIDENGFISEIQFYPPGMYNAKMKKEKGGLGGHEAYKITREKWRPIAQRWEATQYQLKIYGEAMSALPEAFSDLIGRLPRSAPMTFAEMVASEKLISGDLISPSISPGIMGRQDLLPRSQPYASELSSDIPASMSPSTLNQRIGDTSGQSIDVSESGLKSTMALDGDQVVIPGAEQISQRELAERIMESAKRGGYEPMPEGGLFDEVRTKDLFDEFDDDMKFAFEDELPSGERVYEERTVKELRDEFDQDQSMLDRLRGCV